MLSGFGPLLEGQDQFSFAIVVLVSHVAHDSSLRPLFKGNAALAGHRSTGVPVVGKETQLWRSAAATGCSGSKS